MNREARKEMAEETLEAIENGYYYDYTGDKTKLPHIDYHRVEVLSPDKLEAIRGDQDGYFATKFDKTKGAHFYVLDMDSMEAARLLEKPLVMNFANAHRPGGGFLAGANAQEEALCRNSTLFASISSEKAQEMYDYNNLHKLPMDSDYMLLSPQVVVIRDEMNDLVPDYDQNIVGVVTVPAPNRKGGARDVSQEELDRCMQHRIELMLWLAARKGYRNLVLGAWGCGAFGNDTRKVAEYFYHAFYEGRHFSEYFDRVVFAILEDEDKIAIFEDVFRSGISDDLGELLEGVGGDDPLEFGDLPFGPDDMDDIDLDGLVGFEAKQDFPACNHVQGVDETNFGYTQGILADGTPFEAERFSTGIGQAISVIMPVSEDLDCMLEVLEMENEMKEEANVEGISHSVETVDNSVLDVGMVDLGQIIDPGVIQTCVSYISQCGLVKFTGDVLNGSVWCRTDINGNDLLKITVTLMENGELYAETPLHFREFPGSSRKKDATVIQFPGGR